MPIRGEEPRHIALDIGGSSISAALFREYFVVSFMFAKANK